MGIFDRLFSSDSGRGDEKTRENHTREELQRDAIVNERINVMPVEKPSDRLRAAHPDMPELQDKYQDVVECHLFHPDSDITLYPVHIPQPLQSSEQNDHFPLVLGIEAHMEVPFVIFSAEDYFLPDETSLINAYEGGLLATSWGEALVIPCDLALPHEVESVDEKHTIPLPESMYQKTIPAQMLEDEEMESYYNLAMTGMVR